MNTCAVCNQVLRSTASFCAHCGARVVLQPNTVLVQRYTIIGPLGQGGMARVYKAMDSKHNKLVAVKELTDEQLTQHLTVTQAQRAKAEALAAFEREAQILATLKHPRIPTVSHSFSDHHKHYLVMDFVSGMTLEEKIVNQSRPPTETEVRDWALQLCDVFHYLHTRIPPVIFRDLKPSNIIVDVSGQINLIDFGIARHFQPGKRKDTHQMGTPGFAAPEQHGTGQTDARSDIYSIGVLLHHLLTGYDPSSSPFYLPLARTLAPNVSSALEQVVSKATQIEASKRYASIRELQEALVASSQLSSTVTVPSPPVTPPMTPQPTRPQSTKVPSFPRPRRRLRTIPRWIGAMLLLCASALFLILNGTSGPDDLVRNMWGTLTADRDRGSATDSSFSSDVDSPTASSDTREPPTPQLLPSAPSLADRRELVAYSSGESGIWQLYLSDPWSGDSWLLPGLPRNTTVPAWSPDGQTLSFRSNESGNWQIYTINRDGTGLRQLTSGEFNNLEAAWSPDGSQLAFVSDRDGNNEIYLMDSDGENPRRLTHYSGWDDDPQWSPDGNWLIFERGRGEAFNIYKMRSDGSQITRLTHEGDSNSTPAWSPDGAWIAFERREGKAHDIWMMDEQGDNQQRLTYDGSYNLRAAWSPDSELIAHTSTRDGEEAIWVVSVAGEQLYRLSPIPGFDAAWSRK